ncbi:TadE/TadG family type IV pilus assembly protein [Spongiibacter sp.]|uniref:TadE/TadG family type IV pilus assembly protein n=1 Tax=Spongiibacter sp. TaxID=2024860 RepID=UPI0035635797
MRLKIAGIRPSVSGKRTQTGSTAIEFALIFPAFFAIIYAIVSYGMAFLILQSLTYAGEDALRAALGTDCAAAICTAEELEPIVAQQVRDSLSWLSTSIVNDSIAGDDFFSCDANMLCTVRLSVPPVLGGLTLPLVGQVPKLPAQLVGNASLRM